jgi:hypothetical protein
MQLSIAIPFSIVLLVLVLFSFDPKTSLVAHYTYKPNYRDIASSNYKSNKDKSNNKIQNCERPCPQCKSLFLTAQPINIATEQDINTDQGQSVQSIKCRNCGFQWQETWRLPNWIWLKSSSPDNHWTQKWNTEPMDLHLQDLELAQGIKDSLAQAGFNTIDSILKESPAEISYKLGIDPYIAQIIKDAAKRATERNY